MRKEKTQTMRIVEIYVTVTVLVTAATLVMTGIAISKINTDYMQSGVRAAKIVAERENSQISVTLHDSITLTGKDKYYDIIDNVLTFLPPPVNTTYLTVKEIAELLREK